MIDAFVDLVAKFEIILFFTALFIWAESTIYNLCIWHIFPDMKKGWQRNGVIALIGLNVFILICAVFWSGVWVF